MCGIAGRAGLGRVALLDAAVLSSLHHRGPDADGSKQWCGPASSWELAFARLAIVDLSPAGNQPIANEDATLFMVFNGEIYNAPELREFCEAKGHRFRSKMDGEVILHLWEMEGASCLARLNGIFAVAIASTITGEMFLARDPLGVKPLHYCLDAGRGLWFASELASLRVAGAPVGPVDVVALSQFLSFLWIPDPRTQFAGVKKLEPGHVLRWTTDSVRISRYCDILSSLSDTIKIDDATAVRELEERLRIAVRRQLMADVPIGLMASGGIDSGLLWWMAKDALTRAFTVVWPDSSGLDPEGLHADARSVARLEKIYGTATDYVAGELARTALPLSGELVADPAFELSRQIAEAARDRGLKVLLAGMGGDELFGGYRRHQVAKALPWMRSGRLGNAVSRRMSRLASGRLRIEYLLRLARASSEKDAFSRYMQLCTYSTAKDRAQILDCTEAEASNEAVWQRHREIFDDLPEKISFLRCAMALDLAVYLPGLGLSYMDRASMEVGVEVRVPWLDIDLVRWSLTLPDEFLIRNGRSKWLPRELASKVLPTGVARQPKAGFGMPFTRLSARGHQAGPRQGLYLSRAVEVLTNVGGPAAKGAVGRDGPKVRFTTNPSIRARSHVPRPATVVIVVNYRSDGQTRRFVRGLMKQEGINRISVIVVDNSSPLLEESPLTHLELENDNTRVLIPGRNLGYFGAAAWALKSYTEALDQPEWVVVSNPDITFPDDDFFVRLEALHGSHPPAIVAPSIHSSWKRQDENPFLQHRPPRGRMQAYKWLFRYPPPSATYFAASLIRGRVQRGLHLYHRIPQPAVQSGPLRIYAPHGSFIVFHRSYFDVGGTLRYGSFLFGEEIFVGETARRLGQRVIYDTRLHVKHKGGVTARLRGFPAARLRDSYAYLADEFFARSR